MENVFLGMSRRVRAGEVLKFGWEDVAANYDALDGQFTLFFEELRKGVAEKLRELDEN